MRRLAILSFAFAVLLAVSLPVRADAFNDALTKFAADEYAETIAAIEAVTASGHPQALLVVRALADGRLLFNDAKVVVVRDSARTLLDPLTGQALSGAAPDGLKPVRLNNRVRRALEAALGSLTLLSADPARRLDAAQAVFKSRDVAALPAVEAALAKETDPRIKRALGEARAAILFLKPDAPEAERVAAVEVIAARGDQESMSLLRSLPADAPLAVQASGGSGDRRSRARARVLGVRAKRMVRALARLGVATGRHRSRHHLRRHGRHQHGAWRDGDARRLRYLPGAGMDPPVQSGAVRLVARDRGAARLSRRRRRWRADRTRHHPLPLRPSAGDPARHLGPVADPAAGGPHLVSVPTNREVGSPSWMAGSFEVGQLSITYGRLWIVVFSLGVFASLLFVLRFTRFGLEMRAVTQNRPMAASMGIRTNRVDALTFGLGSGIAGMAGVALSQIDNVSPNLGPGLHHRQLPRRRVRRRRQFIRHPRRRAYASASPTSCLSRTPVPCLARSSFSCS